MSFITRQQKEKQRKKKQQKEAEKTSEEDKRKAWQERMKKSTCFDCGEKGHFQNRCPNNKQYAIKAEKKEDAKTAKAQDFQ